MKKLDFTPIKTTEQFLKNYEMHDIAIDIVKRWLRKNGFTVIEYGPDRRNERVWGDGKPDLLAWRNGYWLVFIDCKGHSNDTFILNERAYEAYLSYSKRYQIPVVCIWVNLSTGLIYYAEIPFNSPAYDFMHHDGNRVVKTKATQRIDKLIKRLRMTLSEEQAQ